MPTQSPAQRKLRLGRRSVEGGLYVVTTVVRNREPIFFDWQRAAHVAPFLNGGPHWCNSRSWCWVLMPDHFHVLVEIGVGDSISRLVQRLKAHSSRADAPHRSGGSLWQPGFHDRALRSFDEARVAARYIVLNPVRAGLTKRAAEYPYWNARWL